ncbi:MAG: DegT/DnrJ/EryC1/StrS family aminotransferase [Nitrospirota bacterium]
MRTSINVTFHYGNATLHVKSIRKRKKIEKVMKTKRLKNLPNLENGEKPLRLEQDFARYIGCSYSIAVNSYTAALHLALDAIGLKEGGEVITSPFTLPPTAAVITYFKAVPIFIDCNLDTFNIDPDKIEEHITHKTRAIIPVHHAGHPCDMERIMEIAMHYRLHVIGDASHALPSRYKGKMVGTIGDITCFGFYPLNNPLESIGGMIATENEKFAERIKMMRQHGINRNLRYEIRYPGYEYMLPDIYASIGIHQLKRCDDLHRKRNNIAMIYNAAFKEIPEIKTPHVDSEVQHSWHLYIILLDLDRLKINRDEFIKTLTAKNIDAFIHCMPLHIHPYYRDTYGYILEDFPNAMKLYESAISLPIHPTMSEKDVSNVIDAVIETVTETKD